MTDKESLIEFPCDFPVKIIGTNTPEFISDITQIVRNHFPNVSEDNIQTHPSKKGNYVSISITAHVLDKPSLDAFYQELTAHPDVNMVL